MNAPTILLLIATLAIPNAVLYILMKKFIVKTPNSGMKFLLVNIPKDVVWCSAWLMNLDKTTINFFILIAVFLLESVVLYYFAVREINRS